jgi:lysozyme
MKLSDLKISRLLWFTRESFRYSRWQKFIKTKPVGDPLRGKWFALYKEAHDRRIQRDVQIAKLTKDAKSVSENGVKLIKEFEGFPYGGRPYQDSVGVWTIGYGHTEGVSSRSKPLTEAEASQLLLKDLNQKYAPYVSNLKLKFTQNQFDALTSFVYNVGSGGVASNTTVGRNLRSGNYKAAADGLLLWDKAGGRTLPGLTRRRQAERTLFLKA